MKKISTSTIVIAVILIAGIAVLFFMKAPTNTFTNNSSSTNLVSTTTSKTTSTTKSATTVPKVSSTHIYITISNNSFIPKVTTIKAGTTVTWTNKDSVVHMVTANINGPTSSDLGYNQSYSYKFSIKGIYGYHSSTLYPDMTGTIIVN